MQIWLKITYNSSLFNSFNNNSSCNSSKCYWIIWLTITINSRECRHLALRILKWMIYCSHLTLWIINKIQHSQAYRHTKETLSQITSIREVLTPVLLPGQIKVLSHNATLIMTLSNQILRIRAHNLFFYQVEASFTLVHNQDSNCTVPILSLNCLNKQHQI